MGSQSRCRRREVGSQSRCGRWWASWTSSWLLHRRWRASQTSSRLLREMLTVSWFPGAWTRLVSTFPRRLLLLLLLSTPLLFLNRLCPLSERSKPWSARFWRGRPAHFLFFQTLMLWDESRALFLLLVSRFFLGHLHPLLKGGQPSYTLWRRNREERGPQPRSVRSAPRRRRRRRRRAGRRFWG